MKISQDVLAVISSLEIRSRRVYMRKLERKLYLDVNKVLEALGGDWDRKSQSHVFDDDPTARIELVLVTGEVTTAKDIGFFPTPVALARQLVEMAEVRPGMTCLEPSAGTGRIVDALLAVGASIVAIERDDKMRQALTNRAMDQPFPHQLWVASLERDFMHAELAQSHFDRVVMNPCFTKSGEGDGIDHVKHAFGMLKLGGILVAVLPSGVLFRQDKRHIAFREWVGNVRAFKALPEGSFKESGTMVSTVTLKVVR